MARRADPGPTSPRLHALKWVPVLASLGRDDTLMMYFEYCYFSKSAVFLAISGDV
jgi:hypothetical protein